MATLEEIKDKLDGRQQFLRSKLAGKSLITEILLTDKDEEQAIRAVKLISKVLKTEKLGMAIPGQFYYEDVALRQLRRWSELVSVGMAAVASKLYNQGTYWPYFFEEIELPDTSFARELWASKFHLGLSRLELPSFPEMPLANLGPILMHAGIPTYCLQDMYKAISIATERTGRDSRDVVSYLNKQFDRRAISADVPVQRFIRYGGEFAEDLIDRTITILYSGIRGDTDYSELLPQRFYEAAEEFIQANKSSHVLQRDAHSYSRSRVALNFNFRDLTVELSFPSVIVPNYLAKWEVKSDQFSGSYGFAVPRGNVYQIDKFQVVINKPSRDVEIEYPTELERAQRISLVDPNIPILLFKEDGSQLDANRSISSDPTWVLYPADEDIDFGIDCQVIQSEESIENWAGWRCQLLRWENSSQIKYRGKKFVDVNRSDYVRFAFKDEIPGLWLESLQVHASPPELVIPDDLSDRWVVSGTNLTLGKRFDFVIEGGGNDTPYNDDPFEVFFGALELVVRGNLGKVGKFSGAVLEGATLAFSPEIRTFDKNGLVPVQATLTYEDEVYICQLSSSQAFGEIVLDDGVTFEVRPPVVRVRFRRELELSEWFTSPIPIEITQLLETTLVVEVPASIDSLTITATGVGFSANLRGKRIRETQQFEFNLREFALPQDGLIGSFFIECSIDGSVMGLARVSPARVCDLVEVVDGVINCVGLRVPQAEAFIWPALATWLKPQRVALDSCGQASLPADLASVGDLFITVIEVDPWVPVDFASASERRKTRIARPILEDAPALLRFVASDVELPVQDFDVVEVWDVVRVYETSPQAKILAHKIQQLRNWLRGQGNSALVGLAKSQCTKPTVPSCLISVDLVFLNSALKDYVSTGGDSILDDPLLAVFGYLQTASRDNCPESMGMLSDFKDLLGYGFISILLNGVDSHACIGVFDGSATVMDSWSTEQLNQQFSKWKTIPRARFDGDARFVAIEKLFLQRHHQKMRTLSMLGLSLVQEVGRILENYVPNLDFSMVLSSRLNQAVAPRGWTTTPAISLSFALLARAIAHGLVPRSLFLDDWKFEWRRMADIAPEYLSLDLCLAECFMLHEMRRFDLPLTGLEHFMATGKEDGFDE